MRIKRSRLNTFYLKKRISKKDKEGCSTEEWGTGVPFLGEQWPASDKVQVQQYGDRLNYILNLKLDGAYQIIREKQGASFDFGNDLVFREQDGICIFADEESDPDYRIIAIKPYRQLKMELEKI